MRPKKNSGTNELPHRCGDSFRSAMIVLGIVTIMFGAILTTTLSLHRMSLMEQLQRQGRSLASELAADGKHFARVGDWTSLQRYTDAVVDLHSNVAFARFVGVGGQGDDVTSFRPTRPNAKIVVLETNISAESLGEQHVGTVRIGLDATDVVSAIRNQIVVACMAWSLGMLALGCLVFIEFQRNDPHFSVSLRNRQVTVCDSVGLNLVEKDWLADRMNVLVDGQRRRSRDRDSNCVVTPTRSDNETSTTPISTVVSQRAHANSTKRILYVEDGPDNQRLVAQILGKSGYKVVIVGDGQEAIDEVHRSKSAGPGYDLILMDMQMPRVDGYEATTRLRRDGFRMPIVALTAHALTDDREKCIAAGCSDYLTKPIKPTELRASVNEILTSYAAR